jgi:hydroxyacylglutathione hydrolase
MRIAIVPVTPFEQNCSLVWCTKTMKGALVDPGGDLDRLKLALERTGVTLEKILVTHGHTDHCGMAGVLAREMPACRSKARMRTTASGSRDSTPIG